ncbi:hypothetical protein HSBAA_15510 [Vreelandella sulfidaeris]|uniref:Uncharacterized protein n=1 Tax=Vreelandella sulfidaeris TaxID=115553 RepID=A0A455U325_9GAMM|nr:hypothetical protein HSBAA_15510 [Halomonas sulfidaeris]
MPNSSINTIELADAWEWLLGLRHQRPCDTTITLTPNGEWQTLQTVSAEARELLDCLTPLASRPSWVVAQLGQSMDGRIATESGHSTTSTVMKAWFTCTACVHWSTQWWSAPVPLVPTIRN